MARGGKREGSGRKKVPDDEKKKAFIIYLTDPEKIIINTEAAKRGMNRKDYIRYKIFK